MASEATAEPHPRGWQVAKPLKDCLLHMLDHEIACDVTFQIKCPEKTGAVVSAHKLLLMARSPVFEAMFSGAFVEAKEDVIIHDIDHGTFTAMLRYIYTDIVLLTEDNVMPILAAARKYILNGLYMRCVEFLNNVLAVDNVCNILTWSVFLQEELLIHNCLRLIAPNIEKVLGTDGFYNLSHDALLVVLQCEHLALGVEAFLFKACLKWAERKAQEEGSDLNPDNIRRLLGKGLHEIRFPFIPAQEFAEKFGDEPVLTDAERNNILCLIMTKRRSYGEALTSDGFNIASRFINFKRCPNPNPAHQPNERIERQLGTCEEVFTIHVDAPAKFRGVTVCGGTAAAEKQEVAVTIQSIDKSSANDLFRQYKLCIISPGAGKHSFISIDDIGRLEPDTDYRLRVTVSGPSVAGFRPYDNYHGHVHRKVMSGYVGMAGPCYPIWQCAQADIGNSLLKVTECPGPGASFDLGAPPIDGAGYVAGIHFQRFF